MAEGIAPYTIFVIWGIPSAYAPIFESLFIAGSLLPSVLSLASTGGAAGSTGSSVATLFLFGYFDLRLICPCSPTTFFLDGLRKS